MSVHIAPEACIGCNLCVPVCPNRAIAEVQASDGSPIWHVKTSLCSECRDAPTDFYAEHQCISVCPVPECITIDPAHTGPVEQLRRKGHLLGDYRQSVGLPRNYSYAENSDLDPAPGEFGPEPAHA